MKDIAQFLVDIGKILCGLLVIFGFFVLMYHCFIQ